MLGDFRHAAAFDAAKGVDMLDNVSLNDDDFELGDAVKLKISGESGVVIGKATYLNSDNQIYVHYVDEHGCAKTEWFYKSQLSKN